MSVHLRTGRLGLAAAALCLAGCTTPVTPRPAESPPAATQHLDLTGILLVDPAEEVQAGPVTKNVADALETALLMTETNGDDVGYPWIDPVRGELVLSAATPKGRVLIEAAGIDVPHRIRDVAHGAAELRRIQDDVTLLGSRGVADAELIFMTLPDHRDNLTLIVISDMSRPLLDFLATTYPVDAIAVQIDREIIGAGTS